MYFWSTTFQNVTKKKADTVYITAQYWKADDKLIWGDFLIVYFSLLGQRASYAISGIWSVNINNVVYWATDSCPRRHSGPVQVAANISL